MPQNGIKWHLVYKKGFFYALILRGMVLILKCHKMVSFHIAIDLGMVSNKLLKIIYKLYFIGYIIII
jgi:hypothetical protein